MAEYFHTIADIEQYLATRGLFHMDLSLNRIEKVLKALDCQSPHCLVVQVIGTNGKGSTASMIAALLGALGKRVGLYTSPHFLSWQERISANFSIDDARYIWAANVVYEQSQELTYFEFLTALAVKLFTSLGVDALVLEAGLGGLHDATTAVHRDCIAYTPIALDHRAVLGNTLREIAEDKAGAMNGGMRIFSCRQYPEVSAILTKKARSLGLEIFWAKPLEDEFRDSLTLLGAHQYINAGLAVSLCTNMIPEMDAKMLRQGLSHATIHGRLEHIPKSKFFPELLLDGAHNPHAMQTMLAAIADLGIHPCALVVSTLGDKDWKHVLRLLKQSFKNVPCYIPQLDNERAADSALLAKEFGKNCVRFGGSVWETLFQLPKSSGHEPVLVTGSLYLLSQVYGVLEKHGMSPWRTEKGFLQ